MALVQIAQVIAAISALPEVATEAGVPVLSADPVGALVDRILRGASPTAYQGFGPEPCVLADGVL